MNRYIRLQKHFSVRSHQVTIGSLDIYPLSSRLLKRTHVLAESESY